MDPTAVVYLSKPFFSDMAKNEHQDWLERCADCHTTHTTSSTCPDPSQTVFELFLKKRVLLRRVTSPIRAAQP